MITTVDLRQRRSTLEDSLILFSVPWKCIVFCSNGSQSMVSCTIPAITSRELTIDTNTVQISSSTDSMVTMFLENPCVLSVHLLGWFYQSTDQILYLLFCHFFQFQTSFDYWLKTWDNPGKHNWTTLKCIFIVYFKIPLADVTCNLLNNAAGIKMIMFFRVVKTNKSNLKNQEYNMNNVFCSDKKHYNSTCLFVAEYSPKIFELHG